MSASLLQTAILSGLEGFLNQVITLDPAAASKLAPLTGRILCVRCELPAITMNVLVDADRLVLMGGDNLDADATVSGRGTALARLLLFGDTANLRDAGVSITGDTAFLSALQGILKQLDVDWKYPLSKVLGDIPTQTVSDAAAGTRHFMRQGSANLRDDIDAWLHEEKKLLPDSVELDAFYQAIDTLRLRADRLEARINRCTMQPR